MNTRRSGLREMWKMERATGLEPATCSLEGYRRTELLQKEVRTATSSVRLPPYRLGYARRFMMVGPPGLEPGTPRLKAGCSDVRATDPKGGGQRVFAHQPFRSCAATPLDATITRDAMRKNQPAYIWSRERDLNPQLSDYKSGALRLELSRHKWWTGVDSNHRGW